MLNAELIGVDKALAKLDKLISTSNNLQPALEDMSPLIIQEFKANFEAKGELLKSPWPPRKRNYPWPILNKTGKMKGNWKSEPKPRELTITNPTEYATYHNFGTIYLPVRKLVGHSEQIIKIAKNFIVKHIKSIL